jgi:hypothetical protein
MLAGSGAVTALTTILSPVVPRISRAILASSIAMLASGVMMVSNPKVPGGRPGSTALKTYYWMPPRNPSEGEIHISIVGRQIDRGEVEQAAWVELSLRP